MNTIQKGFYFSECPKHVSMVWFHNLQQGCFTFICLLSIWGVKKHRIQYSPHLLWNFFTQLLFPFVDMPILNQIMTVKVNTICIRFSTTCRIWKTTFPALSHVSTISKHAIELIFTSEECFTRFRIERSSYLVRGPALGVFISLLSLSSSDLLSVEMLSSISSLSCFSTFSSRVAGRPEVRPVISNRNVEVRHHT